MIYVNWPLSRSGKCSFQFRKKTAGVTPGPVHGDLEERPGRGTGSRGIRLSVHSVETHLNYRRAFCMLA